MHLPKRSWSVAALVAVLAFPLVASAQGPSRRRGQARERSASATAARPDPAEADVIQLEETVIEGEIEKPNAFYILRRTQLGYEVLDMRASFLPEVVDTVQGAPF